MQVRLPVVVVGGGLTAIDTATGVARVLPGAGREVPAALRGARQRARASAPSKRAWTAQEREIAAEFLAHARAIRAERAAAAPRRPRAARSSSCCSRGAARRSPIGAGSIDSPSYTLNHEEVEKALEEGIRFAEGLTPLAVEVDAHGHASRARVSQHHNDGDGVWHEYARSTTSGAHDPRSRRARSPTRCSRARTPAHFQLDGKYFRLLDEEGRRRDSRQRPRQASRCPPC